LDPMYMDGQKQPVSLARLFTIVRERNKSNKHDLMTNEQILRKIKESIEACYIKKVSPKFREDFEIYV